MPCFLNTQSFNNFDDFSFKKHVYFEQGETLKLVSLQIQMTDKWRDQLPDLIARFVHAKAFLSKITVKLMGREFI